MISSKKEQAKALKKVMCQLPFPVAIATTAVGKEKRGITIGSFTSLSMQPPLISFNIDKEAQFHDLLSRTTHYAVHLPKPEESPLCNHFATSGLTPEEQFNSVEHYRNSYGNPVLKNISTVIQCRAYEQFEAGDHTIVVGEVLDVDQQSGESIVLYYNRSYRTVGDTVSGLSCVEKSA